ncbi:MAG TPA: hypothetical protein VGC91_07205 [Pyrinomonadaceae bacterium]|jgi:hypothetical protein
MFRILKAIFFWGYARNTWQYDVLCALILAFIFLTPKGWFENGELRWRGEHQNISASSQMLITPDFSKPQMSRSEIEQRVREVTGRSNLTVTDVRERRDAEGKILVYEVDIR